MVFILHVKIVESYIDVVVHDIEDDILSCQNYSEGRIVRKEVIPRGIVPTSYQTE